MNLDKAMAYLGITASAHGLRTAEPGADLARALDAALADLPPGAPIVILVHGYKFDPRIDWRDPHRQLYAFDPPVDARRIRSWPKGLGFTPTGPAGGLCIGFAWPASAPLLPTLLASGRTGFAAVYDRAGDCGRQLAALIAAIQARAPGRAVDVLAHSLGARVALAALPHLDTAPERIILLGAAEFDGRALTFLAAMRAPAPPQIFNVTARANDVYDLMFESFAPRAGWRERALGLGLGDRRPDWLDIQIDCPDVADWIVRRGIRLTPPTSRACHWSFYTRRGAFDLYQAILRRRPGWDLPSLRAEPAFARQEPRWSHFRPRLPGGGAPPGLPDLLEGA